MNAGVSIGVGKAHTVVYACDDNYSGLTAVSAVSVLRWNPQSEIVLLGLRLKPESVELVRSRVEGHGGAFLYFDVSDRIAAIVEKGFGGYTSYAAYARLFIADILRDRAGRVLYLDCDTLVRAPLDELFDMPLNGKPFAFGYDCICFAYKRFVKVPDDAPYYNSGVMLADLAAWRESGATEVLKREFAAPTGPNPLGDQDMIARAWQDFVKPLDPKWNFLSQYFLFDYGCVRKINGRNAPWATRAAYEDAQRAPAVCHFSGNTLGRPWFTSSRHPMRAEYVEAAHFAGLDEVVRQIRPMDLPYRIQYVLSAVLPPFLFQPVARLMLCVHIATTYGRR